MSLGNSDLKSNWSGNWKIKFTGKLHNSAYINIDEKLISWTKKGKEIFIWTKFRDYYPGRASQKALRTVPL